MSDVTNTYLPTYRYLDGLSGHHGSAGAGLLSRSAVQLARRLGIGADVDEGGLVARVLVDAGDLAPAVRRDALEVDGPLACVALVVVLISRYQ